MTPIEIQITLLKSLCKKEIDKQRRATLKDTIKHLEDFKKYNSMKGEKHNYCVFFNHAGWVEYCKLKNLKIK